MTTKKIYVAGPYTKGDVAQNVRRAIDVAEKIIRMGHVPVVPHYSHFQHMVHPQPYEVWMAVDYELLKMCDAVYRIDGESNGADIEERWADLHGIKVYHELEELRNEFGVGGILNALIP